jgi:acyl-CoA dehydrogenase
MDPRCQIALVLAKMDYSHPSLTSSAHIPSFSNTPHQQHTLVLVPIQHITRVRPLQVFGYDDAPHGHAECLLQDILLDESSIILGEGRGFEIAQGRLGPGRIHHCMRSIGIASRCYQLMMSRLLSGRQTFGLSLDQHGVCMEQVADSYQDLLSARLLTLHCARQMDQVGSLVARKEIALIKVAVPQLTFQVVDRAIQIHGAAGLCQDTILAKAYCALRSLRIADGPDAVHKRTVALMEISKWKKKLQMEMNNNKDEEENKKKEERRRIKSTSPRTNSRL